MELASRTPRRRRGITADVAPRGRLRAGRPPAGTRRAADGHASSSPAPHSAAAGCTPVAEYRPPAHQPSGRPHPLRLLTLKRHYSINSSYGHLPVLLEAEPRSAARSIRPTPTARGDCRRRPRSRSTTTSAASHVPRRSPTTSRRHDRGSIRRWRADRGAAAPTASPATSSATSPTARPSATTSSTSRRLRCPLHGARARGPWGWADTGRFHPADPAQWPTCCPSPPTSYSPPRGPFASASTLRGYLRGGAASWRSASRSPSRRRRVRIARPGSGSSWTSRRSSGRLADLYASVFDAYMVAPASATYAGGRRAGPSSSMTRSGRRRPSHLHDHYPRGAGTGPSRSRRVAVTAPRRASRPASGARSSRPSGASCWPCGHVGSGPPGPP